MKKNTPNNDTHKKKTPKQIAALVCVIVLAAMYILTLIVAFLDFPGASGLFAACLLMTIGLPILLWIFIWIYGMYTGKHNITSNVTFSDTESNP